eukprot:2603574-Pyramimonas_sp.AAC.1
MGRSAKSRRRAEEQLGQRGGPAGERTGPPGLSMPGASRTCGRDVPPIGVWPAELTLSSRHP